MTELVDKLPATLRRIASGRVQMRVEPSRRVPCEVLEAAADEIERLRARVEELEHEMYSASERGE